MSFCDFLENELLDHVFGATAYSAPATLYIGLSTTTPTDSGGNFTEPPGGYAYARVAVTNNATNFPAATGGTKANGTVILFPEAAGGSWGTITHFGIFDQLSGGNCLATGQLAASKLISNGDAVQFNVGAVVITLD